MKLEIIISYSNVAINILWCLFCGFKCNLAALTKDNLDCCLLDSNLYEGHKEM